METSRILWISLALALGACQTSEPPPDEEPSAFFHIVDSAGLDSVSRASAHFILDSAHATGMDSLTVYFHHSGGCAPHHFTLYAAPHSPGAGRSTVDLAIHHDANGDDCKALVNSRATFDIGALRFWSGMSHTVLRLRRSPASGPDPLEITYGWRIR